MNKSLTLGTFAGIPVKLHWSYALMILLIGYVSLENNFSIDQVAIFSLIILLVFVIVVLHEYGHALTARRYGIKTKDIILSPIGGIARLEGIPTDPKKELWIALMGPAVNVVLAVFFFAILFFLDIPEVPGELIVPYSAGVYAYFIQLLPILFLLNVIMVLFNMLPAFPMDGGRVLRALLSMKWPRERATKIASIVGQVFAVGFFAFGSYNSQFSLSAIGIFIFLAARAEYKTASQLEKLKKLSVSDVMRSNFTKIYNSDIWDRVIYLYENSKEKNFLVFNDLGKITGVIPELYIKEAVKENWHNETILGTINTQFTFLKETDEVMDVIPPLHKKGYSVLPVLDEYNDIVGLVDPYILSASITKA